MEKPHKGMIVGLKYDNFGSVTKDDLTKMYGPNLGYIVRGRWVDHPDFGNSVGHTSLIVKKGRWRMVDKMPFIRACEIETLNSRYTWHQVL